MQFSFQQNTLFCEYLKNIFVKYERDKLTSYSIKIVVQKTLDNISKVNLQLIFLMSHLSIAGEPHSP